MSSKFSGPCGENVSYVYNNGTLNISPDNPLRPSYMWEGFQFPEHIRDNAECVSVVDVPRIPSEAFRGFEATEFYFGSQVREIGEAALADCPNIEEIDLESVRLIEKEAFANSGLINVKIEKGTRVEDRAFENSALVSADIDATNIGARAFVNCDKLKYATLGPNVKEIGNEAFSGTSLTGDINVEAEKVGYDVFGHNQDIKVTTPREEIANLLTNEGIKAEVINDTTIDVVEEPVTVTVEEIDGTDFPGGNDDDPSW